MPWASGLGSMSGYEGLKAVTSFRFFFFGMPLQMAGTCGNSDAMPSRRRMCVCVFIIMFVSLYFLFFFLFGVVRWVAWPHLQGKSLRVWLALAGHRQDWATSMGCHS